MRTLIPFLLLTLLSISLAKAGDVPLTSSTKSVDLTEHLFVYRDPAGQMTPQEARAKQDAFRPLPKDRVNIGFTNDTLWLRFTLRSEADHPTQWVLELPTARLDTLEWHLFSHGQPIPASPPDAHPSLAQAGSRYPLLPLTLEPHQTVEIYLRLRSSASIVVPLRLFSPVAFQEAERNREWSNGLFFGYVGALAILGVLLAAITRNRILVFYALIVTCLWIDAFCMTGSWSWLGLPGASVMERQGLIANGMLCVVFIILFQRYLYTLPKTLPRLDKFLRFFLGIYLTSLLALPFAPFAAMKFVQVSIEVSIYIGTVALSLYFLIKGFRPARLFFIGWLGFWLLYTFLLLQVLGILPFLRISPIMVEIAFATGSTFFLIAIVGWVREIQRENDRARTRELALQKEMLTQLEKEVIERTADLHRAKEQAEEANRSKGLFLANISHEIRTPLSALVGLSQAMWMQSARYSLPEEFSQFLNQIRTGGQYLNLILTNLLNVSAAEAGRTPLQKQAVQLGDWADSIENLLAPIARNHDVALTWHRHFAPTHTVHTDFVRLTQILLNIAHNAIKFSQPQQTVEITIRETAGTLELNVQDQGPGLLEADKEAIFRAFTQSHGKPRTGDHGVGLGLSVVQLNVELLGGSVHAENRACGGASFTVSLPAEAPLESEPCAPQL